MEKMRKKNDARYERPTRVNSNARRCRRSRRTSPRRRRRRRRRLLRPPFSLEFFFVFYLVLPSFTKFDRVLPSFI